MAHLHLSGLFSRWTRVAIRRSLFRRSHGLIKFNQAFARSFFSAVRLFEFVTCLAGGSECCEQPDFRFGIASQREEALAIVQRVQAFVTPVKPRRLAAREQLERFTEE